MLAKEIEFVDYDGNKRKETHYFNLTEAEALEMELSVEGGLTGMVKRIVEAQDFPAIVKVVKEMILKSYGQKSPDGRQFIKNEKIREEFSYTEAYSKLFMELATDANKAAEFFKGITPEITVDTKTDNK